MDRKAMVSAWRFVISAFALACALAFFLGPRSASAAAMNIAPSVQSAPVGGTFYASVYVQSSDQAVNAISALLAFPAEYLEVVNFSKVDSVVGVWIQEPVYSNKDGTVSFEGIILNPGFRGDSGKVLSIRFRVKKQGSALVDFFAGSVLANDGAGTNVLTGTKGARYTLFPAPSSTPKPAPTLKIPAPGPLFPPRILSISGKDNNPREALVVEGTAEPHMRVNVFLNDSQNTIVSSTVVDARGLWQLRYGGAMHAGAWQARAQTVDRQGGAASSESEPVSFVVVPWARYVLQVLKDWGFVILVGIIMFGFIILIADFIVYQVQIARVRLQHHLARVRREREGGTSSNASPLDDRD